MKQPPLVISRTYDAPVEKVWKAITDQAQMQQWYMKEIASFKPETGFTTTFTVQNFGKDLYIFGRLRKWCRLRKISYEWKYGGQEGNSLVSFELTAAGKKTTLTLTHAGLETFNPELFPDFARKNFEGGWSHYIGGTLKHFVENAAAG